MMQRGKNDRLDARALLEFARRMPFQAWTPPCPVILRLHALSRRLWAPKDTQAAEQNRLHAAQATDTTPVAVRRDLERCLCSLRRALYMPALVTIRQGPRLHGFYEHLLACGKAKMVARVAVMRKLLHAIFGMFKHQTAFDGNMLYPFPTKGISTTEAAA